MRRRILAVLHRPVLLIQTGERHSVEVRALAHRVLGERCTCDFVAFSWWQQSAHRNVSGRICSSVSAFCEAFGSLAIRARGFVP